MNRTSVFVLGLAFVIALLPVSTYAQTVTNEPATNEPNSNQGITNRACTVAKQRIATRASNTATILTDHSAKYTTMKGRVDTLISTAIKAEYSDASTLTAARNSVTSALSGYNAQVKVFIASLEVAQLAPCGEEEGEFTSALNTARTELTTLRETALTVKAAIKQNAVPALRDYATWLKASANITQEKV